MTREEAIEQIKWYFEEDDGISAEDITKEAIDMAIEALQEPKWNCTANFVAEQLERLRKMTDEERWEFFKRFFEMKGDVK